MIVFSAVLANHLGLIDAIEKIIRHKMPIVNCCKCLSFWSTIAYTLINSTPVIHAIAISFAAAYVAVWLELSFGLIDNLYGYVYKSAFTADTEAEDTEAADTESSQDAVS